MPGVRCPVDDLVAASVDQATGEQATRATDRIVAMMIATRERCMRDSSEKAIGLHAVRRAAVVPTGPAT